MCNTVSTGAGKVGGVWHAVPEGLARRLCCCTFTRRLIALETERVGRLGGPATAACVCIEPTVRPKRARARNRPRHGLRRAFDGFRSVPQPAPLPQPPPFPPNNRALGAMACIQGRTVGVDTGQRCLYELNGVCDLCGEEALTNEQVRVRGRICRGRISRCLSRRCNCSRSLPLTPPPNQTKPTAFTTRRSASRSLAPTKHVIVMFTTGLVSANIYEV